MARNKIAGLVLASALLVGANTAHAHKHATSTQNKQTTKVTKNEVLLANANHKMVTNAMVVNGNGNLVLRSQGNKNGKIVSNLSVGEMLKIQSYSQNWYKVTVQETGSTGYISADNLRLIESGVNATPVEMNNNGQVINVSSSLNVRENATMASSVIDSLSNGNQVKVIAKQGEWYKINVNGTIGYVYGEYLNIGSAVSTTSTASASSTTSSNKVANTQKAAPVKKEVAKTNNSTVKETKNTDTKNAQDSKDAKKQLTPAQLATLRSASFAAIPNNGQAQTNNASSQSQVPQIGSATLTLINATSEQVLSNVNVTINGNSFTTNQQGKVKISSIPTGVHTFTVSVDNYNSTSVKVNVKAGKSMNSIVSLSPAQNSDNQGSSNSSSNNSSSSNQSSNNSSSSNQSSSNQSSSNSSSSNQSSSNSSSSNSSSSNSSSSNSSSSNSSSSNQNSNSGLSTSQLQQAIVQYAEQFIGTPYVWGATGPNAFDCSGLTSYVYKHFGYYIGRTTYTQIDAGTPVSTNVNSLQPGDLIFWGDPQAPYHVAIYIGNGQYIQAPKPGETVDISSWHLSDISAARRIV